MERIIAYTLTAILFLALCGCSGDSPCGEQVSGSGDYSVIFEADNT